jgi:hypothetical protein
LDMLLRDDDGHWIVHYLSHAFQFSVTHSNHSYLYAKARAFICEKLSEYRRLLNSKLAFRYSRLLNYFDSHPSSD